MENASKALIIAGAILLSILLISLGLIVYNQAKNTIGSVNLDQQQKQAFNAKFENYQGDNLIGTKVNEMFQLVISSNAAETSNNTGATIDVYYGSNQIIDKDGLKSTTTGTGSSSTTTKGRAYVTPGKKYKVTFEYASGIVNKITVSDA
mgnify:CR=1 FL=1